MEIIWKFNKSITIDEINCFENEQNVKLSESLKTCIMSNNGGRPMQHIFDTCNEKGREIKRLLPFNKNVVESVYLFTNFLEKESVPFAITPNGDLIYEKKKTIFLWEHEKNSSCKIADSFKKFLEMLY